jgi:splicing factor 3B subunit 2
VNERRRRRRKQKKNKSQVTDASANGYDSDTANDDGDDAKENADPQQVRSLVLWFFFC